jgi:hypothetical protein
MILQQLLALTEKSSYLVISGRNEDGTVFYAGSKSAPTNSWTSRKANATKWAEVEREDANEVAQKLKGFGKGDPTIDTFNIKVISEGTPAKYGDRGPSQRGYGTSDGAAPSLYLKRELSRVADLLHIAKKLDGDRINGEELAKKIFNLLPQDLRLEFNYSKWSYEDLKEDLNERVTPLDPTELSLEGMIETLEKRLSAAKRGLSIAHRLKDSAEKRKHFSAILANMNVIRAQLNRVIKHVEQFTKAESDYEQMANEAVEIAESLDLAAKKENLEAIKGVSHVHVYDNNRVAFDYKGYTFALIPRRKGYDLLVQGYSSDVEVDTGLTTVAEIMDAAKRAASKKWMKENDPNGDRW